MNPETRFLGASDIRRLAAETDLSPSKSKGQNFVIDANTVRKIVNLSGAEAGEHVLEVGPGFGSLTVGLAAAGCRLTVIEIDSRLAHALPATVTQRVPTADLSVVEADALSVDSVPGDVVSLVANLPYNVAVPVLIHLLEIHPGFRRVLVMVQAEVGWRLAAAPGSEHYGAPSVKVAWWGEWAVESTISRRVFWPEPRVDSVLVGMRSRDTPGDDALRKRVFSLVDSGFRTRRKMSRQALSDVFGSSAAASEAITAAGLNPESRCETWSLDDFVRLAHHRQGAQ